MEMIMIQAPAGVVARYKHTRSLPDGTTRENYSSKPVIAFNDEGDALVLGESGLRQADSWGNFDCLDQDGSSLYTALIPGGGWLVKYTYEDGSTWTAPVTAWGLTPDGIVDALGTDSDGIVEKVENGNYQIFHPDSVEAPAPLN